MINIKDIVKDSKKVTFTHYQENNLWYITECDFKFPVPIADTGNAKFMDKAMLFMRYIRKHIQYIEISKELQCT